MSNISQPCGFASFAWQRGFAAFSVSASNKDAVVRYIRMQDNHHRKMGFEAELIALLEKHGVQYDMFSTSLCRAYGAHNSMHTFTHGVAVG